jgi:hypothetical protein
MISSASFQKLPNGDEKNYKYKEDPLFFTQFIIVTQTVHRSPSTSIQQLLPVLN